MGGGRSRRAGPGVRPEQELAETRGADAEVGQEEVIQGVTRGFCRRLEGQGRDLDFFL